VPKPFENDPVAAALPHGTVYAHTDSPMLLLCCPIRHVFSFSVDKLRPWNRWRNGTRAVSRLQPLLATMSWLLLFFMLK
jgi:hypothetical protein